jgi:mycothiol synthase
MKIYKNIETIKPYDSKFLPHLIQFKNEIEKQGLAGCGISLELILAHKGIVAYNLEKNLYVIENAGSIKGYVHVLPEPFIKRCVVSYLIHPADRTDRLSKYLLDLALQRTKELKLVRAHVFTSHENFLENKFLGMMDFKYIRRFSEMKLDLKKAILPNGNNVHFLCRAFNKGEEAALTRLQNRSFKNTWGFNPNTVEEITYRTELPDCLPEGIIITWDADRPIAYCWTKMNLKSGNRKDKRSGRIQMLGVDPDYRGLGLAKQVFTAGLSYLIKQGIENAQITVDSENKAALTLYKSAGFEIEDTTIWFEKKIKS